MNNSPKADELTEKVAVTLPRIVDKVVPAIGAVAEKAQITVEGAEPLYKEIRVENNLQDSAGNPVALKKGAEVQVTIEGEPEAAAPKKPDDSSTDR